MTENLTSQDENSKCCPLCGVSLVSTESNSPISSPDLCSECGGLTTLARDVLSRVKQRYEKHYGNSAGKIDAQMSLDDLALDSMETMELVLEFEETYVVSLPYDEVIDISSLGELIRLIQKKRQG